MPTTLTLTPTNQVLTVPTSWADVTLAQFVTLHAPEPGDARTAAEVLLGLPAGGLSQLAAQDVVYLATLLEFGTDPGPVLELLPTVGLPDVGSLPYGTLLLGQQYFEAEPDRNEVHYLPYVLALYRTQLLWGKHDEGRVAKCLAALLAAPVTESYPDAVAFYGACRQWLSGTPPTKPTTQKPATRNWTRTLTRRWLNALDHCLAWIWRRVETS